MAAEYVDSPDGYERVSAACRAAGTVGYDTEFDGVDINSESPVGRAKVHVFSLAAPGGTKSVLGYNEPTSWVLPARAFAHPAIRGLLEDPSVRKAVHNQPVDSHATANSGVQLRGGINTLAMARFLYPWRSQLIRGNFDLDSICKWRVGFGKTEDFDDFLGYDAEESYEVEEWAKLCGCGEVGCRKKKAPHDSKSPVRRVVQRTKKVRRILALESLVPGHNLWDRYIAYAACDAELALILYQCMVLDGQKTRPYPWGYDGL
jgi:hypothetical protein